MAALILPVLLAPLSIAAVSPVSSTPWHAEIAAASLRFGVPESWIRAVIRLESGGRTALGSRPIRSPKGAMGLMQLMPGTWRDMRVQHALGSDPDAPADNILAGTAYLRVLYDQFGYPGLFAAYNAGPARYLAWRDRGVALPAETRAYLASIRALLGDPAPVARVAVAPQASASWRTLFVPLASRSPDASAPR